LDHPIFQALRLAGFKGAGVIDDEVTRTVPNPLYEKAIDNRTSHIALAQISAQRGGLHPSQFVATVQTQLDGVDPADRPRVNAMVKRKTQALQIQQGEIDHIRGFESASIFRRDGVTFDIDLAHRMFSTNSQVMAKANVEYEERRRGTVEFQRAEGTAINIARTAERNAKIADMNLKIGEDKFAEHNASKEANRYKLQQEGVFINNGSVSTLTEKQRIDGFEDLVFNDDGSISDAVDDNFAAQGVYIAANVANWEPMRMAIPSNLTGIDSGLFKNVDNPPGHWRESQGKIWTVVPQEIYENVAPGKN